MEDSIEQTASKIENQSLKKKDSDVFMEGGACAIKIKETFDTIFNVCQ